MPDVKNNIYLVGPMGSGKTTIGTRLARKFGLSFHDSDHEIETRTGATVGLIFDIEGEEGFRQRESRMLRELAARKGVLVATGGGSIVSKANRDLLRKSGIVVYLRTSVKQQLERLGRDHTRPLLQTRNREIKLLELAKDRNPLYEEIADLVVPVKNRKIDSTVNEIYQAICTYRDPKPEKPNAVKSES